MGTHHNQVWSQFTYVIKNATRYICYLVSMDMSLHAQIIRERALSDVLQVATGLVRMREMTISVNCLGRIALNDMYQRYRCLEGRSQVPSSRKC
jgi:hypothetical protein